MLTEVLLALVLASVVLHELVLVKAETRAAIVWARRLLLLLMLVSATFFGARAQLTTRVQALLQPLSSREVAYDAAGDPALKRALSNQRPDHPFPVGGSRQAVEEWRRQVVQKLRLQANIPDESPSTVATEVLLMDQVDGVRRTLVRFRSWDGTMIPAYVLEPEPRQLRAGVLVIPGHGSGIRATAGVIASDYQHAAALELARQGYVTLTPELRGFGMLTPDGIPNHRTVAAAALEAGSFYKAVVVRDLTLALTVLQRWAGVDSSRVAVAGASLGGELAVLLGVVDQRPRVVISHSYGGRSGPVSPNAELTDRSRQTPHGCHTIPGINRLVWQEDWFRLIAPRPVLLVRGSRNARGATPAFSASVKEAFAAHDANDRFEFSIEEGGHEFFVEPAAAFLAKWL